MGLTESEANYQSQCGPNANEQAHDHEADSNIAFAKLIADVEADDLVEHAATQFHE
jgi:hypothetical protein